MVQNIATNTGQTIFGALGKESNIPMYIQFVTGYCSDVCHSSENIFHKGTSHTNTIMAVAHQSADIFKTQNTEDDSDRFYPLLRTMHDVPSKGDPVLLTQLGGVNYYLGPLNMPQNNPTWNDDINYRAKASSLVVKTQNGITTTRGETGESLNFNKKNPHRRLIKKRKEELDGGPALYETTGDTLIEGRHGNSLRIGSRSDKPYIFISNARDNTQDIEKLTDGSLISITSFGTLQQHFEDSDLDSTGTSIPFRLSSDGIEDNTKKIGDIYSYLNNNQNVQEGIYNYNGNQILFQSDRITLNSKLDDIFVSSIKDIYIGAGENLSINSFKTLNILSNNINIGNPNSNMESMVLGDTLFEVLNSIIDFFTSSQINTGQMGLQSFQMNPAFDLKKLSEIKDLVKKIKSTKHKIEQG
jgi:hypothetical protein